MFFLGGAMGPVLIGAIIVGLCTTQLLLLFLAVRVFGANARADALDAEARNVAAPAAPTALTR